MKKEKFFITSVFFWIVMLVLGTITYSGIELIIFAITGLKAGYRSEFHSLICCITYLVLIIMIISVKRFKKDDGFYLKLQSFNPFFIIKPYIVWMGMTVFYSLCNLDNSKVYIVRSFTYFINRFLGKESFNPYTIFITDFLHKPLYVYNFISIAILGPIVEELIFRKIVYNDLKELFNIKIAVVISSVLFGLMHFGGGFHHVVLTVIYGFCAVYCYEKTQTIFAPILLHSLTNFTGSFVFQIVNFEFKIMFFIIFIFTGTIFLVGELVTYLKKRHCAVI